MSGHYFDMIYVWTNEVARMRSSLRLIGYSSHTGNPRFGEKAELARWGLGEGPLPRGYSVEGHKVIWEPESAPPRDAPH